MKISWNVPNILTMIRMACTPAVIVLFLLNIPNGIGVFVALGIYILACFTDFLDGYIARKNNMVTSFGKFIDPLADKLLVMALLIFLTDKSMVSLPLFIPIIILAREFFVSGVRLVCVLENNVIAASKLGKYKTATTMAAIIVLSLVTYLEFLYIPGMVLMYIAVVLTIVSGVEYFWKNRHSVLKTM